MGPCYRCDRPTMWVRARRTDALRVEIGYSLERFFSCALDGMKNYIFIWMQPILLLYQSPFRSNLRKSRVWVSCWSALALESDCTSSPSALQQLTRTRVFRKLLLNGDLYKIDYIQFLERGLKEINFHFAMLSPFKNDSKYAPLPLTTWLTNAQLVIEESAIKYN